MLGCIQPMSSPMMKRMMGFCCCADAVPTTVTVAKNVSTASQTILVMLMVVLTILSELLRRPTVCVQLIIGASMAHEAVIDGKIGDFTPCLQATIRRSGTVLLHCGSYALSQFTCLH